MFQSISAITLGTRDMARAVDFYGGLGFVLRYGGPASSFTSFVVGQGSLNLVAAEPAQSFAGWGRVIFHVDDVDALYARATSLGHAPEAPPRDASWGERYFHLVDPDGHELSFAKPLGH